jgi:hypothetical protein
VAELGRVGGSARYCLELYIVHCTSHVLDHVNLFVQYYSYFEKSCFSKQRIKMKLTRRECHFSCLPRPVGAGDSLTLQGQGVPRLFWMHLSGGSHTR